MRRTVHVKKCHPEAFDAIRKGYKQFEWRKEDDCTYAVGDTIMLLEYEPPPDDPPDVLDETMYGYTGEIEKRLITYVLRDRFDMPKGFVVLQLGAGAPPSKVRP